MFFFFFFWCQISSKMTQFQWKWSADLANAKWHHFAPKKKILFYTTTLAKLKNKNPKPTVLFQFLSSIVKGLPAAVNSFSLLSSSLSLALSLFLRIYVAGFGLVGFFFFFFFFFFMDGFVISGMYIFFLLMDLWICNFWLCEFCFILMDLLGHIIVAGM